MSDKMTAIKNIVWAMCIVICIFVVSIALIVCASRAHFGERDALTLELGASEGAALRQEKKDSKKPAKGKETQKLTADGSLHELPFGKDAGEEYIQRLTFLCDSVTLGLRDYALVASDKVWATESGELPMSGFAEQTIVYPGDGSLISPADAAMIAKPDILVIAIGSDGLFNCPETAFRANYKALLDNIAALSPDTTVICCSITPPTATAAGVDVADAANVGQANLWLKTLCAEHAVWFADLGSVLGSGELSASYASSNGRTLNSAGVSAILDYLRRHSV